MDGKSSVELSEVNDFSWDDNGCGGFNTYQTLRILTKTSSTLFNYKFYEFHLNSTNRLSFTNVAHPPFFFLSHSQSHTLTLLYIIKIVHKNI